MAESTLPAPLWQNLPSDRSGAVSALLESFLRGKKKSTLRAYQQGLKCFASFLSLGSVNEAAVLLFSRDHGTANKMALDFKSWMMEKKYAAATINNRLSAVRSMVDLGRRLGLIPWSIEVDNVPEETYRETAGPGIQAVFDGIQKLRAKKLPLAARDASILSLMGILGMRRGEVVSLDLSDWNGLILMILGKGRTAKEPITIPGPVQDVLLEWLGHRGSDPGPLFYHFAQKQMHKERLSGRSVGRITGRLGLGHAHGLRHSAITEALEKNKGDVRKVAKFSRHKNIQTLLKYDDNRRDFGGEVASDLADGLKEKTTTQTTTEGFKAD